MSLIERLKRELRVVDGKGITTMEHVEYQGKLAAQSLVLDFRIAIGLQRAENLVELADGYRDGDGPMIH